MSGRGLPRAQAGQRIGLLGGSFDPAHAGHLAITRAAIARFGLDRVWWLVTPGNPLKPAAPAPQDERIARACDLARDPRIIVTDLERRLGTRYTAATITRLVARYPGVRFVWLMGADNLAQVHRWDHWQRIFDAVPVGIIARPGNRLLARRAPAARVYASARVPDAQSHALPHRAAPAWCYIDIPLRSESSTALRRAGAWGPNGDVNTARGEET